MPPAKTYQEAPEEAWAENKLIRRKLVPALLERYNTTPTYIVDPRTFSQQFKAAMYKSSSVREFLSAMASIKYRNLTVMLREIQNKLAQEDGYDGSFLSSLEALLALSDTDVGWEGQDEDWTDSEPLTSDDGVELLALDEFWNDTTLSMPQWMRDVYDHLPENTHPRLPEEYTSEESHSQYSHGKKPLTPKKTQERGAARSTTISPSTSEGRTLRNGKRTRSPDDSEYIIGEAPKNKRQRKGKAASCPSASPPGRRRASPLGEEDGVSVRRSGRLNRNTT